MATRTYLFVAGASYASFMATKRPPFVAANIRSHTMATITLVFVAVYDSMCERCRSQGTAAGKYAGPAARSALRSSAHGLLRPLRAFRCSRFQWDRGRCNLSVMSGTDRTSHSYSTVSASPDKAQAKFKEASRSSHKGQGRNTDAY